jgi:hypothetical protein
MVLIENSNADLRSWFFSILHKLSHKTERQDKDKHLSRAVGYVTIPLVVEVREQLQTEATKRSMTIAELCSRLVSVVANDGLIAAVLDDEVT